MTPRFKYGRTVVVCAGVGLLVVAWMFLRRGDTRDANTHQESSGDTAKRGLAQSVNYSAAVERLDLSGLNSHVASPTQKVLFKSAISESLSHYLGGSGFDVQMFVHQEVLQSSEPPDIKIFDGNAKFHDWFWSSIKCREGDARVYPILLAGKLQPSPVVEGENHMIGRRTSGLPCHGEPLSSQYCYEVQTPIEYKTLDGTAVKARLGIYFQWSEQSQRWVQSGVSLYGFPVGQPIFPLPG